jgi:hypothetical protein
MMFSLLLLALGGLLALQAVDPKLATAAVTASPTLVTDPILSQLTASSVAVWLIQWMKNSRMISFLSEDSALLTKRFWAVAFAAATTLGINFSFDVTLGQLTVTGLTLAGISDAGWAFVQSLVAQQLVYHGVVKSEHQRVEIGGR